MHDITVLGTLRARLSGPITPRYNRADDEEDALLARVLITSWSLATGRTLRSDVPPQLLTEDELIAFWADDTGDPRPSRKVGQPDELGPAD
jgi:hypothetical protein